EIPDFGGAGAKATRRTNRAKPIGALHQVALDLSDTEQITVSTNDIAGVLKPLLVRVVADDKVGERLRLWIASSPDFAAQAVTKGVRCAMPLAGARLRPPAPAPVLAVSYDLAFARHQAHS